MWFEGMILCTQTKGCILVRYPVREKLSKSVQHPSCIMRNLYNYIYSSD